MGGCRCCPVFCSLSALALAVLFITRLRIIDNCPLMRVNLILPATGALPRLENLFDALAAQSLQPSRLVVAVESVGVPPMLESRPWPKAARG
jgi:hypothetical protein